MSRYLAAFASACLILGLWLAFPPKMGVQPRPVLVPEVTAPVAPPTIERAPITLPKVQVAVDAQNPRNTPVAASYRYRRAIKVAAVRSFGPHNPPVALLAAQIHQESKYSDVISHAGALGYAQFMPRTAALMARRYPELRPAQPRNAAWAFRAQALHMHELMALYPDASLCDRWAFSLSAYNGGPPALTRERARAKQPNVWFGQVELERSRSLPAFQENRHYVRNILHDLEPAYSHAGWPGGVGCGS